MKRLKTFLIKNEFMPLVTLVFTHIFLTH